MPITFIPQCWDLLWRRKRSLARPSLSWAPRYVFKRQQGSLLKKKREGVGGGADSPKPTIKSGYVYGLGPCLPPALLGEVLSTYMIYIIAFYFNFKVYRGVATSDIHRSNMFLFYFFFPSWYRATWRRKRSIQHYGKTRFTHTTHTPPNRHTRLMHVWYG